MYEQLEPFGERGAYWRAGLQASLFMNANRKKGVRRVFDPKHFMPDFDGDDMHDQSVTIEEVEARVAAAAARPHVPRPPKRT